MPIVASPRCEVVVIPPKGRGFLLTTDGPQADLVSVETGNDLAEAVGHFSLTLAPVEANGRTWAARIPLRSLVYIRMFGQGFSTLPEHDGLVMLGLTDDQTFSGNYTQRDTQRTVMVAGRSIAAVLLDAKLFFHEALAKDATNGTLSFAEGNVNLFWRTNILKPFRDPQESIRLILEYFLFGGFQESSPMGTMGGGPSALLPMPPTPPLGTTGATFAPSSDKAIIQVGAESQHTTASFLISLDVREDDASITQQVLQAMAAANAGLPGSFTPDEQQETLGEINAEVGRRRSLLASSPPTPETPLTGEGTRQALINLQLPEIALRDVLDINASAWTTFDAVTVPIVNQVQDVGSIWNYVQVFVDKLFQEFFTRIEDGTCKTHFRAKPFKPSDVSQGSRFQDNIATVQTLRLDQGDILQEVVKVQSQQVYNVFWVYPLQATTLLDTPSFKYLVEPEIIKDPAHPSFVGRWGLRVIEHASPYLSGLKTPGSEGEAIKAFAAKWAKILRAWYGYGSELASGYFVVRGHSAWNIGHILVTTDALGEREFYIEGVSHAWDARTGSYTTRLRVTRGWYRTVADTGASSL